jgi:predicted dehydrogenase
LAERFGSRSTANWQDAIRDERVDIVAVCTTNQFLAPIAIAALKAGKHVLCEKPMGRNAGEAGAIASAASDAGRVFKVGFTLRFHPALREARQVCARGELGPLFFVRAVYGHGGRVGYEREWRADPEEAGGGELLDQGIHLLDLSRWFLGNLEVVAAIARRWYWDVSPLEDNAFVLLRSSGGQVASLHTSWTMWKNRFSFEVLGRDGYARIDGLGGAYGTESLTIGRRMDDSSAPIETVINYAQPDASWTDDWRDLIESIERGRAPEVGAIDGLAIMELADRAYARAAATSPAEEMEPSSP